MKTKKTFKAPVQSSKFETTEQYHASFNTSVAEKLNQLRHALKQAAPKAEEIISYNMPTFKGNRNLVHYAAFKNHIGFYPTPSAILNFKKELEGFITSKGAVQFPLSKPLPIALIKKIVAYRVAEDDAAKNKRATFKQTRINKEIVAYNQRMPVEENKICNLLAREIVKNLPDAENKIWHAHPVWFIEGNPVVGYSKLKDCIRLLFWSGQSFNEKGLQKEGSFKAAEKRYTSATQVNKEELIIWLNKCSDIQWDYKNLVKRKGLLLRLK